MREAILRFGEGGYLMGVRSAPAPDLDHRDRPGFIFLNAGLMHRSGPSRAYVDIARRLAQDGFAAFRFDHGGIGDSDNRRDTASYDEATAREVAAAMDYMGDRYARRFYVLVGLCSGARLALRVAADDPRVVGVVSVDGSSFPTARFWWHRYRARRRSLLSCLLLRIRQKLSPAAPTAVPAEVTSSQTTNSEMPSFQMPTKEEVARDLKQLVSRNVRQYWFYTGSFRHLYNYREQHRHAFRDIPFGKLLHVEYMPDAEHILTSLSSQRLVIDGISQWAREQWPSRSADRAVAAKEA